MTNDALRADIFAQNGQWSMAVGAVRKAIETNPENIQLHYHLCLSLFEMQNNQAYRQVIRDLFAASGKSYDFESNNVAWCCVLGPGVLDDAKVSVHLAESAMAAQSGAEKGGALNTLGAALCRAGRYDEAIARLNQSVQAGGGVGIPQDWAFLAMAHIGRGDAAAARGWLQKLRSYQPGQSSAFDWRDVEIRCLRNEAEALMLRAADSTPELQSPKTRPRTQRTNR